MSIATETIFLILLAIIAIASIITIILLIWQDSIKNWISIKKRHKVTKHSTDEVKNFINTLASCLAKMSYDRIGAIIVVENHNNMQKYINNGKQVQVNFFLEFVINVFSNHNSPIHDGAIIVRNLEVVSVSSYLPLTKKLVPVNFGARHRAGIGICEHCDCYSFVVSETNGDIHFYHQGEQVKLSHSPAELAKQILNIFAKDSIYKHSLVS